MFHLVFFDQPRPPEKVSDQKDTTRGTSANTKFAKQSILGKPPSSSISTVHPKVGETHALSKPVTSNSIPTPQGSKVVKNVKEATKFVGDFKSLANEADASLAKYKALELKIKRLLKAIVSKYIMIIVQNESVVDTSDLQTELERTKERLKTVSLKNKLNMLNFGMIGIKSDKSENTKFAKQPIVENLLKIAETNALSKPVTSNSVSTPQESKGVNNDKVIAPGMFRINPSKTSREEKHVPNTVSARTRTKPITVSQPPVIIEKNVNSDLNGLSSTRVDNTKSRRPQPRSYTKHDRVPSGSKSSQSKNKEAEVEEHHRNLLLSKNNKHISSA
nr:hypothetical protein [Tanacetum cinerariifolium]